MQASQLTVVKLVNTAHHATEKAKITKPQLAATQLRNPEYPPCWHRPSFKPQRHAAGLGLRFQSITWCGGCWRSDCAGGVCCLRVAVAVAALLCTHTPREVVSNANLAHPPPRRPGKWSSPVPLPPPPATATALHRTWTKSTRCGGSVGRGRAAFHCLLD